MALSLHGWGRAEFGSATPDFLAAARWAVLLDRLMPIYQAAQARLNEPMPSEPLAKLAVARVKTAANSFVSEWSPILFPVDDDGE